jgi:hypothetical protein
MVHVVLSPNLSDLSADLFLPRDDRTLSVVLFEQGLRGRVTVRESVRLGKLDGNHCSARAREERLYLALLNKGLGFVLEAVERQKRLELPLELGAVILDCVAVPLVERLNMANARRR